MHTFRKFRLACRLLVTTAALCIAADAGAATPERRADARKHAAATLLPATPLSPQVRAPDLVPRRPLVVRAAVLGSLIGHFAGRPVHVPGARVVGMFGPRVLVVETATRLRPAPGYRDRVLVLIDDGAMRVPDALLVGETVEVVGVARTLLGMRVTGEVPWPVELERERLDRLDIRAAILASSVRTAEGVELTDRRPGF